MNSAVAGKERRVFVYGTPKPGQLGFPVMEGFVVGRGEPGSVTG